MRLSPPGRHQRGHTLTVALMLLMLVSMAVVGSARLMLDEQRIGANQTDRHLAFELAELALRQGEAEAEQLDAELDVAGRSEDALWGRNGLFTAGCANAGNPERWRQGLCAPPGRGGQQTMPWLGVRTYVASEGAVRGGTVSLLHPCGQAREFAYETPRAQNRCAAVVSGSRVWANPRYLIELVDPAHSDARGSGRLYRITARAWGKSANTVVTLQSFYLVP